MGTKAIHGKWWTAAPRYWTKYFEPYLIPVYKNALRQLNLSGEESLLDAGCGAGLFCSMAIASRAAVTGVDAASGLLEIARQRNPDSNFLEEDLQQMPFSDNSFDIVTAFNSFQYACNIEKVFAEAKRVLKPGGRLVIACWDNAALNDAAFVLGAIDTLLPSGLPAAEAFALSSDGRIDNIVSKAGMKMQYKSRVACPFLYQGLNHAIRGFMAMRTTAVAIHYNPSEILEESIATALQPFHVTDDIYFLQNHVMVYIAKKPDIGVQSL